MQDRVSLLLSNFYVPPESPYLTIEFEGFEIHSRHLQDETIDECAKSFVVSTASNDRR